LLPINVLSGNIIYWQQSAVVLLSQHNNYKRNKEEKLSLMSDHYVEKMM